MVEKDIRGAIYHAFHQYANSLSVNKFKWVQGISESDESFIENYIEESDEGYFLT